MSNSPAGLGLIAALCLCAGPRLVAAQPSAELVPGAEFAAGANLTEKNVKADVVYAP